MPVETCHEFKDVITEIHGMGLLKIVHIVLKILKASQEEEHQQLKQISISTEIKVACRLTGDDYTSSYRQHCFYLCVIVMVAMNILWWSTRM